MFGLETLLNKKFAVGLAAGAAVAWAIGQGYLNFGKENRFLGIIKEDPSGFGLDDVARLAAILAAAKIAGNRLA